MLFSIIIPVYNAAHFIDKAIDSILYQSFSDFEIILVNDGSKDDSEKVMRKYQGKDSRIKLITIENSGPAVARNVGIAQSKGDYLLFVDSDDSLLDNSLNLIALKLEQKAPDLLIFGYFITDPEGRIISKNTYAEKSFSEFSEMNSDFALLYQHNQLNQVWNKAFKNSVIKGKEIRFSDYRYGEDRLFVLDVLRFSNTILILSQPLYLYMNNPQGSLITKYQPDKFEICRLINQRVTRMALMIGTISSKDKAVFDYMFFKNVISSMVQIFDRSCDLSFSQRKALLSSLIHDQDVIKIGGLSEFGYSTRLLRIVVGTKMVYLNLLAAGAIQFLGRTFPYLFIRMKHHYSVDQIRKTV